jgi:alkylation response protein AidB-like acyl-CoA dehydrogenase
MSRSEDESVDVFRARAAAWITEHLPVWDDDLVDARSLQRRLFDGGFAGIAFPRAYGGAGLTLDHQKAFFAEAAAQDRQVPTGNIRVSIGMLGPTLLECGSEDVKLRFLPSLLRGDALWMQLLSEPQGGSDMAGARTRLTRDGDAYVLNGAKMWSSGAHEADFGLCLCRSDWDVPKHRGLSMIAVPLKGARNISIQRTRSATGLTSDFCEEFFDDVVLPLDHLVGDENDGWAVAQTLLRHERNTVGNIGYGHLIGNRDREPKRMFGGEPAARSLTAADRRSSLDAVETMVVDAYIESVVAPLTSARVMAGLRAGTHQGQWGSLTKLQSTVAAQASVRTALAAWGADGVIWEGDEVRYDNVGTTWLESRGGTIAGGTNEMQRNIIAERLLGLPREPAADRDLPFSEVLRNARRP